MTGTKRLSGAGANAAPVPALRSWWRGLTPRTRAIALTTLCIAGVALLAALWQWQRVERVRLASRTAAVEATAKRMQDDVAEVQRLRARAVPPPLAAQALADSVTASLKARNLQLAVTPLGADRLRVQGSAGFDETVTWLGAAQRDYRLSVVSMSATRQSGNPQIEAVLATAAP